MGCTHVPNIIELETFNGDYEKYEKAVYEKYEATFGNKQYYYKGKRICHKKHPLFLDKSCTFWHIVSSGPDEEKRTPDLRRYERIAWPSHILGYCCEHCDKIRIWENIRKGKKRVLIWCPDIDYIVVLDNREDYYIFWTAYPVTYNHARKKLLKEYNDYISKKD